MLPEQQQRILGYFIEEAKDHLSTLEQGLLALQNTINDPEMLKEVYRAAHSVKGGAGMLGYSSIQKTAHLLEDCFKILEGTPVRVDQKLESLFLRVFDTLQSLVEQLQGPFGLPDDVATSLMLTTEPVFNELQQHLEVLIKQPAGAVKVTLSAAPSKEQLQRAFKLEVVAQLRQMLQLFKPPYWPDSRQDMVLCCETLRELGDRFNISEWSDLLGLAAAACANPDNSAQTLAPVIIKEIKQAQELVLAGRSNQISKSEQLVALGPPAPTPEEAIASELENLLAITGDDTESDWFKSALENTAAPEEQPEAIASQSDDQDFLAAVKEEEPDLAEFFESELEATPAKTSVRVDRPAALKQFNEPSAAGTTPADPAGPEVGAAELSSLADLFFEEVPELDSTWQVEEIVSDIPGESAGTSLDDFNEATQEFADLLAEMPAESAEEEVPEDDTITLFGQKFLEEESQQEQFSPSQVEIEDEFSDLFDDDSPTKHQGNHPQDDNLGLFDDESAQNNAIPVESLLETQPEDELADLFDDDYDDTVSPEAIIPDRENISLFDESFLFEETNSDEQQMSSIEETDNLSELFAGLKEDDLWEAEMPNESETFELATEEGPDFIMSSNSNWLENWQNEAATAEVESELGLADFEPSSLDNFPNQFYNADEESSPNKSNIEDLEQPQIKREEISGAEAPTPNLSFGDADFSFTSVEDEPGGEFGLLGFEEIDPSLTAQEQPNAEASELGDDFDFDVSSLFAETGTEAILDSKIDAGASTTNYAVPQSAKEESLDDFFSLNDSSPISHQESLATDPELDASWLEASSDLFADMEPDFDDVNLGLSDARLDVGFNQNQGLDLFGDESADSFDLFGTETSTENAAVEISSPSTTEALFGGDEAAIALAADDEALDWSAEINPDAENGEELLVNHENEASELLDFSSNLTDENEEFSLDELDLEGRNPEASVAEKLSEDDEFSLELSEALSEPEPEFSLELNEALSEPEPEFSLELGEEIEPEPEFSLELGEEIEPEPGFSLAELSPEGTSEDLWDGEGDFADLEALLGEQGVPADGEVTEESADLDFADLEAMLGEEGMELAGAGRALNVATKTEITPAKTTTGSDRTSPKTEDNEFADLEELLINAESLGGPPIKPRQGQTTTVKPRGRIFEQTMKVPVKQLDNLTNLVGELVVNRNSLEQDQERLRQFLDNLLHQVQQLSDVGARMQDLYERSLLESALLASRQTYRFPSAGASDISSGYSSSSSSTWDHIEMDRFTPFHSLSQEMIELIVRVRESSSDIEFIVDETDQVSRQFRQVTTQLQEGLTRARMVPFAEIERVFPLIRYVRDKAAEMGKQAELRIEGRETLIDKLILEHLSDPMKHLINNALVHGIESPEVRQAAGKSPVGRITISAFHQGNQTVISFSDDGGGIDVERLKAKAVEKRLITSTQAKTLSRIEAYELLYLSGLSTKDKADLIAGKGVGMDVVRTNVSEIRGTITTDSTQGKGTSFTIRLPLTLSICKALCCVSDQARIAFPMDGVEDALDVPKDRVQINAEGNPYIQWRDMQLPFKHLNELLAYNRQIGRGRVYGANKDEDTVAIVVLRSAGNFLAIQVDQVVGEQEIVIKQLEGPMPKPVGIAGATVMGDGRIMPIGDVLELLDIAMGRVRKDQGASLWEQNNLLAASEAPVNEPRVLIVDDSITVRELLSMTFNKAGYRVEQARDGQEAWDKLKSGLPCDIVFCDIEMPRMDGLELLSRLNKDPELTNVPIAMLTSRGAEKHRQMAFDLGASGYFTKPYLEEALLDAASRMLKGEKLVTTGVSSSS